MPAQPVPLSHYGTITLSTLLKGLGYVMFVLFIFFACFAFIQPSPYDFIAMPTMLVWLLIGIRLSKHSLPFLLTLVLYNVGIAIALLPYLGERNPVQWSIQSFYLMITGVFFLMFFSDKTEKRMEMALLAYLASCFLAATLGIIGYFEVVKIQDTFVRFGRATGTFNDPNVLGSFLILGCTYLIHNLLTGHTRWPLLSLALLLVLLTGIFLSYSRGSWAAALFAFMLTILFAYGSSRSAKVKRRIVIMGTISIFIGISALTALLSVGDIGEKFEKRAQVSQDYDEGETGRFGNQLRSIPMLMERPFGFGPLRFRLEFGLEPHNSYIGGFANGGWLSGFMWLGLVLTTIYVGFRLCLTPSPYQRLAQIVWPALFIFFLQAVQIDVEKWRHVYMMLGMLWGLEVARIQYLRSQHHALWPSMWRAQVNVS
jgi:hypothetical protein